MKSPSRDKYDFNGCDVEHFHVYPAWSRKTSYADGTLVSSCSRDRTHLRTLTDNAVRKTRYSTRVRIQSPSVHVRSSRRTRFSRGKPVKRLSDAQTCRSIRSANKTRVWLTVGNRAERERGCASRGWQKGNRKHSFLRNSRFPRIRQSVSRTLTSANICIRKSRPNICLRRPPATFVLQKVFPFSSRFFLSPSLFRR